MKTSTKIAKSLAVGILTIGIGLLAGCSDPTKIEGDTAKVRHEATHRDSAFGVARDVAESIYSTAKAYPNIKKIEVTLELDPDGVKDGYGKEVKGPLIMGTIEATDLDDIRKYADSFTYFSRNKDWYEFQVKGLKYARALDQYEP